MRSAAIQNDAMRRTSMIVCRLTAGGLFFNLSFLILRSDE